MVSFASLIKDDIYELVCKQLENIPHFTHQEFIQDAKDTPLNVYNNKTPRDLIIKYSNFIKDIFGASVFTRRFINKINQYMNIHNHFHQPMILL